MFHYVTVAQTRRANASEKQAGICSCVIFVTKKKLTTMYLFESVVLFGRSYLSNKLVTEETV